MQLTKTQFIYPFYQIQILCQVEKQFNFKLAPATGFEPVTFALTERRSTVELHWKKSIQYKIKQRKQNERNLIQHNIIKHKENQNNIK